jgi:hypothetical protein
VAVLERRCQPGELGELALTRGSQPVGERADPRSSNARGPNGPFPPSDTAAVSFPCADPVDTTCGIYEQSNTDSMMKYVMNQHSRSFEDPSCSRPPMTFKRSSHHPLLMEELYSSSTQPTHCGAERPNAPPLRCRTLPWSSASPGFKRGQCLRA